MRRSDASAVTPWVPARYGNRFIVARLVGRWQRQEEQGRFATLWEAQCEADRLNGVKREIEF